MEALAATETRRYRVGLNIRRFYQQAILSCLITFILGVGIATVIVMNVFSSQIETTRIEHERELSNLRSEHKQELITVEAGYQTTIINLNNEVSNLQDQLADITERYDWTQEQSVDRLELLRKYWYVLRDGPTDGTISVDVILWADECCKRWNINPDWMWHIYWVESGWNIRALNSKSSATGLGQVLPSTGAGYWTSILKHNTSFNTSMLYDPYVNIEITTAHIGHDLETGMSFWEAVNHYSGNGGQEYFDKVVSAAANHGISLSSSNYQYH